MDNEIEFHNIFHILKLLLIFLIHLKCAILDPQVIKQASASFGSQTIVYHNPRGLEPQDKRMEVPRAVKSEEIGQEDVQEIA